MSKRILFALLTLGLVTMACGFNINLPKPATPGPDVTDKISVHAPDAKSASLTLTFGAGKLDLASGAGSDLVNGTVIYNIPDFKPEIKQNGSTVTIKQGEGKAAKNIAVGLPVDSSGEVLASGDPALDRPVANAIELVHRLAKSEHVHQVFVRHAFRYWLGRNETLDDAPTLQAAYQAYKDSNGSMKALIISLLTSDSFLYRRPAAKP